LLRLFTEIQLCRVLAVSLVLQMDILQLDEEGYGQDFYQKMLAVILGTLGVAVALKTLLAHCHVFTRHNAAQTDQTDESHLMHSDFDIEEVERKDGRVIGDLA